jgi:putative ABC transport system permease protein
MLHYLPLIWKNCLRNPRRTLLTLASVALSMCLLGVLFALYYAFYYAEERPEQALRLVTRNRVSLAVPMPIAYRSKIAQLPGVREVMAQQWFGGVYKDPKNMFARFAAEPDKLFRIYTEYRVPEDQQRAFQRERNACMIGKGLAEKYNLKLGDRIMIEGDIFPVTLDLVVRAINQSEIDKDVLFFNIEYLFELLGPRRRDLTGAFVILADSPENVPRIAKAIDDMFRNSPVQTRTETEKQFALSFLAFLGNVKLILLSICAAVTFTILLVTANTMAMSTRERTKEVGVLKTLGFSRGQILSLILGEAALISFIGGVLGWLLANGLAALVRRAPALFEQLQTLSISAPVTALLLAIAMLVGILSSLIPALNASRIEIVDSLRAAV